ncbi:MAG: cation:proton antiporter [Clostridiales bacterium]|nr:cation:proton antiporter [Clostridiales bacterium]
MEVLLYLGIAMAIGLVFNRIVKKIGLPNVTGYLLAGLIAGPYVLNIFPAEAVEQMDVITNVALGFIAFSIGGSFKISNIKAIGAKVLVITVFEACTASLLVTLALYLFGFDLPICLALGAIAAATAPAATLLVVRQYNADGPVTRMLLPVVAMDDAICLLLFSILSSIAAVIANGTELSVGKMLLDPLKEIGLSVVLGAAVGFAVTLCAKLFKSRANRIAVIVCSIFICVALADKYDLSSLLVCMMNSAIMVNFSKESDKMLDVCDRWTPPLFLLFFVISGAELNLSIIPQVGLMGIIYILARALGKYAGATAGSAIVGADKQIVKYLGLTLIPQAGVAIAMSQLAIDILPQYGEEIRAVILSATLVYELVGPLITKLSLTRAGEIQKTAKKKST